MLTIPNYLVKIGEAIWLRVTIGLFFYLSLIFARMFVSAGAHDHPYLVVICDFFYEATCILIFNLLYGRHSVGRDINFLSILGLISIPIYFFLSFVGVDASQQQRFFAKALNVLIVIRCLYMAERDLFATFSPINIAKKWLLKRQWFVNSYINTLTVAVFAFLAVPLFTMMYFINTDEMRASGIAAILFAFYIAFEKAKNQLATPATNEVARVEPVTGAEQDELAKANEIIFELNFWVKTLLVMFVILGIGLFASVKFYKVSFFDAGYASGYSDAKSGAAPKREANFQKALDCIEVNRNRFPTPSDAGCPAIGKPWN
jgi:hypothetical protein